MDYLHICCYNCPPAGLDDAGTKWLELLRPFTAVQALPVSEMFAGHLVLALENVTTETIVLLALDLFCLEGQPSSAVGNFVALRQLSGRPITIVDTLSKFAESLWSYPKEGESCTSCVW